MQSRRPPQNEAHNSRHSGCDLVGLLGLGGASVKVPDYQELNDAFATSDERRATIKTLRAEVAALREDANRYKWLKENVRTGSIGMDGSWLDSNTEEWDRLIDFAMKEKP